MAGLSRRTAPTKHALRQKTCRDPLDLPGIRHFAKPTIAMSSDQAMKMPGLRIECCC